MKTCYVHFSATIISLDIFADVSFHFISIWNSSTRTARKRWRGSIRDRGGINHLWVLQLYMLLPGLIADYGYTDYGHVCTCIWTK